MKRLALLTLLLSTAPGCALYFGDDTGDDCTKVDVPAVGLRDPYNGQCEYTGGGGGGCGAPASGFEGAPVKQQDWATCYGACDALDENSCLAADGCRAIYTDALCDAIGCEHVFAACWGTAPSGPIRGGDCSAITDAYQCSLHDDCSAVHAPGPGNFESCIPENATPGCYSDMDCPAGDVCTASTECLPPPGCDPSTGQVCPAVCYGRCVPAPPPGCMSNADCASGEYCAKDPACLGGPIGCTGTCVATPPPACAGADENTCIDLIDGCWTRDDGTEICGVTACEPLYEGSDCTCDPMGCHCNVETYVGCRDAQP
jgi:Cys-rich repeat protein